MTYYHTDQSIRYEQVPHTVPFSMSSGGIAVHDEPRKGTATVHIAYRVGKEWRIWALDSRDKAKPEKRLVALRVPPDKVEIL